MIQHTYKVECITNLHVGDGDANYNIIDNQVQRDVVLDVPTIHSSGVKGALRSFMSEQGADAALINRVFGSDDGEKTKGEYKFFSGNMVAMPLRISDGNGAYMLGTCPAIIENEIGLLKALGMKQELLDEQIPAPVKGKVMINSVRKSSCKVEGMETVTGESKLLSWLIGGNWALLTDDEFKNFDLPVQARNVLKDGKSMNLWYEEIVPHKSIFYISILTPGEVNELDPYINQKVVQFGADASIGYGYCSLTKVGE